MKKIALLSLVLFSLFAALYGQKPQPNRFIGERIPQYMGSGSTSKLPVVIKGIVVGLTPNAQYKYYVRYMAIGDTASSSATGAGDCFFVRKNNTWLYSSSPSLSTSGDHDTFTTNLNGEYRGWFAGVHTGDSRFTAGKYVYPMIVLQELSTSNIYKFYTNDSIQVLDFSTASGSTHGTGIYGKSYAKDKNVVLLYDNDQGTGRPIAMTYTENESTSVSNSVGYYSSNVDATSGAWGTIIPNSFSLGVQRIEARGMVTDTIMYANVDKDGIWGKTDTTVNRRGGASKPVFIPANEGPLMKPDIQFWTRTSSVTEGNKTYEVYVKCKYCNNDTSKVTLSVISGTATNGTDYVLTSPQVLKFGLNNDYTDTVKITIKDDQISEGDETIIIKLTSPANGALGLEETHTVTINDNEVPQFSFANPVITGKESDLFVKIKIKVNFGPSQPTDLKVLVKKTGDSTYIPSEFRIGSSNRDTIVQFAGGTKVIDSLEFKARVFKDNKVDPNDTIYLVLRRVTTGIMTKDSICMLVIKDIDAPPVATFSSTGVSVKETVGSIKIRINIQGQNANQSDLVLKYVPTLSSASEGSDFTFNPTSKIYTFASSTDPDSIVVTIPVLNDDIFEQNETAVFVLGNFSNTKISKPDTFRLKIINDDLPVYPIKTVTSVKVTGVADSLNVACRMRGIVYGINMRPVGTPTGFQFTLIDRTGGIQVFSPAGNKGYTVTEGDSIMVSGRINQFNGMIQIGTLDTIIKYASGKPLMQPLVVTKLDETTESEFVKLNLVRLIDPSQWPSTPMSANTTKDLLVHNQKDTFIITIDSDTDIDGTPAPSGFLNITGIGAQYDATSPYTTGYVLFPRKLTDIQAINTPLIGFITTSQSTNEFYSDSTGAITVAALNLTSAINVRIVLKSATAQNPRDYVHSFPMIISLSPATPSYTFKINLNDDLDPDGPVNLVLALRNNPYGTLLSSDSTHTININDNETQGVNNILASQVNIYPNPAADMLQITSPETISEVSVINIAGQVVLRQTAIADEHAVLNLQDIAAGVYTVRIATARGTVTKTVTVNR